MLILAEECQWALRNTYPSGVGLPGGGIQQPSDEWLISAEATTVKIVAGDRQNVPSYSSWEIISVAIFPVAY